MKTLAERIRWILENCINPKTGEPWREAQALGEAAGLPSPAHVGMMKGGRIKNPRPHTLEPIARVARVSFEWLQRGVGTPRDLRYRELPEWPEMLEAARIRRATMPEWVWEKVGSMRYELDAEPAASMVIDMADFVLEHQRLYKPRVAEEGPRRAKKRAGGQDAA